ncbi:MAG: hypothetical protein E6419_04465 [Veillonella sp.]|nr:hypothetical protein [Veillonella sp.]
MKHRMSRLQRAKQFMPFAALKGFETLLAAVAKPKEVQIELSEDQIDELNKILQTIHGGEWVGIDIPFRYIKELNLYDMTI